MSASTLCAACSQPRKEAPHIWALGRGLSVQPELWHRLAGHEAVPDGYSCNGCGPGSSALLSWFIPDKILGVHVDAACAIHDAQCSEGGDAADFLRVSRTLGANVYACLRWSGVAPCFARFVGARYRVAVHVLGASRFGWADDARPRPVWVRLLEAWRG